MQKQRPQPCPPEFARSRQFSARHEVFPVRSRSVGSTPHSENLLQLTPIPLMNRQTKQSTRPGVPSTYAFAIPNNATDGGVKNAAPTNAARRRSSATHFPARLLRHFFIMRSERRPAIGAPTFRARDEKETGGVRRCQNAGAKGEVVRVGLTQVTNAGGYETGPYQCLVVDVVSLSLEHVIANHYRDLSIDVETTHESDRKREE